MEQNGSFWMDFDEIRYLSIFWKSFEKVKVCLNSDNNNGYFTWKLAYIYDNTVFFFGLKNIPDKICRENHDIQLVFKKLLPT